jgi:signal recognition particle GTPase
MGDVVSLVEKASKELSDDDDAARMQENIERWSRPSLSLMTL